MTIDLKNAALLPILLAATGPGSRIADEFQRSDLHIGPYRIVAALGSGGMGEVYLGEQTEPVLRRAAVKVVRDDRPSDDGPTGELARRLEVERQLLAVVHHENVVRLYDAGTTATGEPWLAMEYVAGEPLTTYCDERRMGLDDRLELFGIVCDAVQHLHDLGIHHRDLKPDNILVIERDGRPVPKIIDLGLAAVPAWPTSPDHDDRLVGTPTHMAPEQFVMAEDQIDARADVHALGVILYELLVGALPYGRSDWTGRTDRIDCARPLPAPGARLDHPDVDAAAVAASRGTSPRSLVRRLRGGLDAIARRAVSPQRRDRYASVRELAMAVRADLDGVAARRTAWRTVWIATAGIGAGLLGGAAIGATLLAGLF